MARGPEKEGLVGAADLPATWSRCAGSRVHACARDRRDLPGPTPMGTCSPPRKFKVVVCGEAWGAGRGQSWEGGFHLLGWARFLWECVCWLHLGVS